MFSSKKLYYFPITDQPSKATFEAAYFYSVSTSEVKELALAIDLLPYD